MTLTLLAVLLAPLYFKVVLDPKDTEKALKEIAKSSGLRMVFSLFYFILALLIFGSYGFDFALSWDRLIVWLGAVIALKGILMLSPSAWTPMVKKLDTKHYPALGFIGLLFVLFLVYVDTQLIA